MKSYLFKTALASVLGISSAASTFSPARPPSIPLAIRSPYLNTWLDAGSDGGNGGYLAGQWAQHWANEITAWTGLIRVDGTVYTWMGAPQGTTSSVDQVSLDYTSTRSIFSLTAGGKVAMNVTFLSPIAPNDMKRQSLVFSYMNVEVQSMDGASHDVQLYSDISAEWVSGDPSAVAQWDYDTVDNIAYHKVYKQTQELFTENSDRSEWGDWYWATDNVDGLTFQSGSDADVRGAFGSNGVLANTKDTNFRPINQDYPVFGYAVGLGSVGSTAVDILFSIGLTQTDAVQFDGAQGIVTEPSLWTAYFSDELAALSFFHQDYSMSSDMSTSLDNQIASDSMAAGGQDYLTITSLALRQTFGATQLVGTEAKQYLFLKEISSDGNTQTVDVIFPAHPAILYTNPALLKLLLDPLFENQEAGHYPNTYSMHDLGGSWPNATGHPDGNDEQMPLEECGNMLIMTLAYSQRANDVDYLKQHYAILKQWTGYLVNDSLYPSNQISTDDFAGPLANQTNLALKGMIGIKAMSVIANLTGNADDATSFSNTAQDYITQWVNLSASGADPPHTTLSYGSPDSYGLLYNLYGDALLGLNFVPKSVYDSQSAFYPTVKQAYGVPLDTRHTWTKGDWEIWTAAVSSGDTRTMLISDLANWINTTPTYRPLTDLYDAVSGNYPDNGNQFTARPVVGGTFALLVLPK